MYLKISLIVRQMEQKWMKQTAINLVHFYFDQSFLPIKIRVKKKKNNELEQSSHESFRPTVIDDLHQL